MKDVGRNKSMIVEINARSVSIIPRSIIALENIDMSQKTF